MPSDFKYYYRKSKWIKQQNSVCKFRIGSNEKWSLQQAASQTSFRIRRVKGRREACILKSIEGKQEACIKSIEAIEIGGEVGFFKMLDDQKRANHVLHSLLSKISRGCLDLGYKKPGFTVLSERAQ